VRLMAVCARVVSHNEHHTLTHTTRSHLGVGSCLDGRVLLVALDLRLRAHSHNRLVSVWTHSTTHARAHLLDSFEHIVERRLQIGGRHLRRVHQSITCSAHTHTHSATHNASQQHAFNLNTYTRSDSEVGVQRAFDRRRRRALGLVGRVLGLSRGTTRHTLAHDDDTSRNHTTTTHNTSRVPRE
jgi:hypothetical protein